MSGNKWKYRCLPKELRTRFDYRDFLRYRMQELSVEEIREFMTLEELEEVEKKLNADDMRDLFNHKKQFYSYFSKWIHREILPLAPDGEAEFEAFVLKHRKVILKPDDGYAGIGLFLCRDTDLKEGGISVDAASPSFAELCEKGYIAEEYVEQAENYRLVHPSSLNTIRVTTLVREDGSANVLFAVNQFGSHGSLADNTDLDGIWAVIDDETGIVTAAQIDHEGGYINEIHPDTKQPILGFVNPAYPAVRELALSLAQVVPSCRLVGWDIAVKEDGSPELIEGNVTPELDLYQEIAKKGLRRKLGEFLQ